MLQPNNVWSIWKSWVSTIAPLASQNVYNLQYTEEFKLGAVAQITDKGHSVTSVAGRLGVSTKSLYDWVKRYGDTPDTTGNSAEQSEIKRLKAELRRVTEERDILKKATVYFAKDRG